MTPTSPLAYAIRPLVRLDYEPFEPDLLVDDELDLAHFDLPGVKAKRMPGHTRGSLVVLAGPHDALVGDQMLGGIWGGLFHAGSAGQHYYQLDADRNECNVHTLLERGVETFHVGHGGPLFRDAVLEWAKSWDARECAPERRPGPPPTFPMCRRAYP